LLDTQKEIDNDVLAVGLIDAVPTLLQVLCDMTGMGFAAVARVSAGNWTACVVRDQINFGLKPGSQLELSTTLCCESREARQAIVIDDVANDPRYHDHHTPKIYGFQSYISVPIILSDGDYFGNLCAIDPKPLRVSDPKIASMCARFAQLIASQIELKRMQQSSHLALLEERAAGEMRELLMAILGCDLRKPLRTVHAAAEKLEVASEAANVHRGLAAEIKTETRRMSLLIDEVLDFSQARFGKGLPTKIEATDRVADILNDAVCEARIANPRAKIISNILAKGAMRCDLHRVHQLLSILLGNALDYGAPQGPISAVAGLTDGKLVIEVWNDGEPIAAEHIDKIFLPLWRQSSSESRRGVGLGLYVCAQIVRAHNGTIAVLSRKGEGTLFTANLPI
jgi:signal transduction histidine kinase